MKKSILLNILVDIYVIASVLVLFFFSNEDAYEFLFALGAKSWLLCLTLGSAGVLNQYVGIIALLWMISFPILFIVFYIMSCKKRHIPLCALITIDTMISLVWFFCCLINADKIALGSATLDAIVSTIYTVALLLCLVTQM